VSRVASLAKRFLKEESGATMVEYGIMVAVIAAVSIAIIRTIGNRTTAAFTRVSNGLR
jgi:pilus assembly protein Flp/PilA